MGIKRSSNIKLHKKPIRNNIESITVQHLDSLSITNFEKKSSVDRLYRTIESKDDELFKTIQNIEMDLEAMDGYTGTEDIKCLYDFEDLKNIWERLKSLDSKSPSVARRKFSPLLKIKGYDLHFSISEPSNGVKYKGSPPEYTSLKIRIVQTKNNISHTYMTINPEENRTWIGCFSEDYRDKDKRKIIEIFSYIMFSPKNINDFLDKIESKEIES